MVDSHSWSFFGSRTGLLVKSTSRSNPLVHFTFIKKKSERSWEKPSRGEGIILPIELEDLGIMLDMIDGKGESHSFKARDATIDISWAEREKKRLWIQFRSYRKLLDHPQVQVFRALLSHLFREKIEFGTNEGTERYGRNDKPSESVSFSENSGIALSRRKRNGAQKNDFRVTKERKQIGKTTATVKKTLKRDVKQVSGTIKFETNRAVLLEIGVKEHWIPKSTIHSLFTSWSKKEQAFLIDSWILERNEIDIQNK